ncbi:MAG: PQQ-binding-like beta-propeller repeat protein, partial [Dehalococcoidia bacterium]|nr:PQQ-binding-like beta-propeller repeat protein [Dehalococcoidia bacterium]
RAAPASGEVLSPGTHALSFEATPLSALNEAVRSGPPYTHRRVPKENRFVPAEKSLLRPAWERSVEGRVQCTDVRNEEIAVGTTVGQVALLDRDGRVRWTHGMGAEVRTVHLADLDGERMLLAGGRDCALTLFDATGTVCWKREFIVSHGRDQIVNAVTTADLMGDGKTEIVVATDGWLVWALTPGGEEVWQRQIEHHAAQTLVIADVEGDGKQEILVGTEYYTSNMLEADGRIRWTVRGGPCFTALALADLNGDGIREAIYGAMDGNVYVLDSASGQLLWTTNIGDDVRHGVVLNVDREVNFVAGSENGNVALLGSDGQKRWRRDLDAAVTGLVVFDLGGNGRKVIAAGTSEGWVVLLSPEGEIVGSHRMDAGVSTLTLLTLPDGSGLLVGTEEGLVAALGRA